MCILRANYVKEGDDLQTEEKMHCIHLYAEIVHSLCIGWAGCVTNRNM